MNRERKHIRLRNFDYSSEGAYFITANTKKRRPFFGAIDLDKETMVLNEVGLIADEIFDTIEDHHPHGVVDEYTVMPDHVHCILFLFDPDQSVDVGNKDEKQKLPFMSPPGYTTIRTNRFSQMVRGSVSLIVQQYKAAVTRECNRKGLRLAWQDRFHDHVIRSEAEYLRIKKYIQENVRAYIRKRKGPPKQP